MRTASAATSSPPCSMKATFAELSPARMTSPSVGAATVEPMAAVEMAITVEMRMPLAKLAATKPVAGTRWRLNLYRCDKANSAYLAWSPVLKPSFHTPEKFGVLEFGE